MATPPTSLIARHLIMVTIIGTVILAAGLITVVRVLALADPAGHLTFHTALAVPTGLLALAAIRLWPAPRPRRLARVTRAVLVGGLVLFSSAQLVEGIGALGYDGNLRVRPAVARLHDVGIVGTSLGQLILTAGALFTLVAALQDRRLPRPIMALLALLAAILVLGLIALLTGVGLG